MNFEKELNDKQLEAVTTEKQYLRIIAGAGSGKTRVLTYRIAYLISEMSAAPWSVLAITFTNKVAKEMKTRVSKMIPDCERGLTIRTYHSFAANFLRYEISSIDYPSTFSILDEEDQTKVMKDIASEMGFKRGDKIVSQALSYISNAKLREQYPDDIKIVTPRFPEEKTCLEMYHRYEEIKEQNFALDFDDLLLKTNYILENYPDIRHKWQAHFKYILVDEFQDTNDIEYKLIKLLMTDATSLYVVGDPDQTIYTWRGANQKIILDLAKTYPSIVTIKLEQNYRSTQTILNSANKLIANNKLRIPKDLYTKGDVGEPIVTKSFNSSKGEADYISREIGKIVSSGTYQYSDIVVLYRSNYVTIDFESALTSRSIPYCIYGGQKFYQRREIKDVLAYFTLIINTENDIAFERIMNVPRRGIGESSAALIKSEAHSAKKSMYQYIAEVEPSNSEIPSRVINALKVMIKVVDKAREEINKSEEVFSKILEDMIQSFDYYTYLLKEDDGDERIENVKALFGDLRHFLQSNPESSFSEYLQNVALVSSQDEMTEGNNVTLMTAHTAKGLEYPVVFVVRFNESVFPHARALNENGYMALEEERRLAYVAITRAKKKLYLTCSSDYSYVAGGNLSPSRFYEESGNPLVKTSDDYNPYRGSNRPTEFSFHNDKPKTYEQHEQIRQDFSQIDIPSNGESWAVGDKLYHDSLGEGTVVELEGDDIIKVNFKDHGLKSILGSHPKVHKRGNLA